MAIYFSQCDVIILIIALCQNHRGVCPTYSTRNAIWNTLLQLRVALSDNEHMNSRSKTVQVVLVQENPNIYLQGKWSWASPLDLLRTW